MYPGCTLLGLTCASAVNASIRSSCGAAARPSHTSTVRPPHNCHRTAFISSKRRYPARAQVRCRRTLGARQASPHSVRQTRTSRHAAARGCAAKPAHSAATPSARHQTLRHRARRMRTRHSARWSSRSAARFASGCCIVDSGEALYPGVAVPRVATPSEPGRPEAASRRLRGLRSKDRGNGDTTLRGAGRCRAEPSHVHLRDNADSSVSG